MPINVFNYRLKYCFCDKIFMYDLDVNAQSTWL